MEMIPITSVRKAQLEWEREDYNETVAAAMEAYEDVMAGRTQPAEEFLDELRVEHGFPR